MKKNYETSMTRLEEIVLKLEDGKLSLEESIKLFEEGASLANYCHTCLVNAEQKIVELTKSDLKETQDESENNLFEENNV